jgi:hypothetical protein
MKKASRAEDRDAFLSVGTVVLDVGARRLLAAVAEAVVDAAVSAGLTARSA